MTQRIVAIVGRPNVGKSAMFNRIVRRRLSIVHEEVGVTRDRVSCEATWNDRKFELIDTGGLGYVDDKETRDLIEGGMRQQVSVAIEDAAAIILAVDITAGVHPLDQEVARLLRVSGRPVVVAANKSDNDAVETNVVEFEELGFPVFPVSALHNRGFDPLIEAAIHDLPEEDAVTAVEPLRIAVVGKPNAGKSSFINSLINDNRLIVSDIPGTTRDSVEIPFTIGQGEEARHYQLIDTAGMRHIRRKSSAVELFSIIRAKKAIERADVVIHMMDATEGPTRQDKKIATMVQEHHKGCLLLINKWDLARGKVTAKEYRAALYEAMPFLSFAPVLFVSAKTGLRILDAIQAVDHVAANITTALSTGVLNRVLHDAMNTVAPPAVKGRRFKFYYCTQTGTRPVRITLFANDPKGLPAAYRSYLINQLRRAYGLEGAPLVLKLKASHESKGDAARSAPKTGRKKPSKRPRRQGSRRSRRG